ncbi:MAG: DNA recombination/repair protein RecA, partial [Bacteroidetes bacterium]|nr:DNA recombination/repair protein RecA [Bacteroidota bacterium]
GRDGVKTLLLDNPDLMDELEAKIKATVTADHLDDKI